MTTKIFDRDFYAVIRAAAEDGMFADENITNEMILDFCDRKVAAIDRKKEKAAEKAAEKKEKVDELREVILSLMTGDYQTIADILERLDDEEVTASKVSHRLGVLVREGIVEKTLVSAPAIEEGGKPRRVQGYKLA